MSNKYYALVYQAGIANVFLCENGLYDPFPFTRTRILQHSFDVCEWFCRGLIQSGEHVVPAWCNLLGDIANASWNFARFEDAPFCENFGLLPPITV